MAFKGPFQPKPFRDSMGRWGAHLGPCPHVWMLSHKAGVRIRLLLPSVTAPKHRTDPALHVSSLQPIPKSSKQLNWRRKPLWNEPPKHMGVSKHVQLCSCLQIRKLAEFREPGNVGQHCLNQVPPRSWFSSPFILALTTGCLRSLGLELEHGAGWGRQRCPSLPAPPRPARIQPHPRSGQGSYRQPPNSILPIPTALLYKYSCFFFNF